MQVVADVRFIEGVKVVSIKLVSKRVLYKENQMRGSNKMIKVKIVNFGVSLISNYKSNPIYELLYLSCHFLEFAIEETNNQKILQLKVNLISIDDNTLTKPVYPVVFCPYKSEKLLKKRLCFLNLVIKENPLTKDVRKKIKLNIQPTYGWLF